MDGPVDPWAAVEAGAATISSLCGSVRPEVLVAFWDPPGRVPAASLAGVASGRTVELVGPSPDASRPPLASWT